MRASGLSARRLAILSSAAVRRVCRAPARSWLRELLGSTAVDCLHSGHDRGQSLDGQGAEPPPEDEEEDERAGDEPQGTGEEPPGHVVDERRRRLLIGVELRVVHDEMVGLRQRREGQGGVALLIDVFVRHPLRIADHGQGDRTTGIGDELSARGSGSHLGAVDLVTPGPANG